MSREVHVYTIGGGGSIDWVPGVVLAAWGGPGRARGAVRVVPKTRNCITSRVKGGSTGQFSAHSLCYGPIMALTCCVNWLTCCVNCAVCLVAVGDRCQRSALIEASWQALHAGHSRLSVGPDGRIQCGCVVCSDVKRGVLQLEGPGSFISVLHHCLGECLRPLDGTFTAATLLIEGRRR